MTDPDRKDSGPSTSRGTPPPPSLIRALITNVGGVSFAMGLLLIVAMLLQGVHSTRHAAQADIEETLSRAVVRLQILIEAAEMTARSLERASRLPSGELAELRPLLEHSLAAFEQRPELSYVGIVLSASGEYGNLERRDNGDILLWLLPGQRTEDRITRNFSLTSAGFVLHQQRPTDGYDARLRPFYHAGATATAQGRWIPVYEWILHFEPRSQPLWGLSYVKPLRAADGRLLGVLDADFDLPSLNRFLQALGRELGAELQVVELGPTPRLIGGGDVHREPRALPAALTPALATPGFVGRVQLDGNSRWLASAPMELAGGVRWQVLASRPADAIAAPLRHQLYQVLLLSLLTAVVLLLLLNHVARRFGRPLAALEQRVSGVSRNEVTQRSPATRRFRETALLDQALSRMEVAVRQREAELQRERDYAESSLDSLPGVFYHYDEQLRLQRWNRNLERVFGYDRHTLLDSTPTLLFAAEDHPRVLAAVAETLDTGEVSFEADIALDDGRRIPYLLTCRRYDHAGRRGLVGTGIDISQRRQAKERLLYLATHDALTGLANRTLIEEQISEALAAAPGEARRFALLYLDLDRFKVINDGYGHPFGDSVIKAVGERLQGLIGDAGVVARQGGDEFLILLQQLDDDRSASEWAQHIVEALAQPYPLQEREVHLSASVGISRYPQDGATMVELIDNANVAMYRAKELGRNLSQSFTVQLREETQRRIELESRLHGAIAAAQLSLVYQPKIRLRDGQITGCEALLRWHHPELGEVPPSRFIPTAEDSGLIVPIGDWVLREACTQAARWRDAGLPALRVAVNLSARQFLQQDVERWVLQVLQDTGLSADQLELELTESLIARDADAIITTVARLQAAGVSLSIDDFGTGYSNLSYLKRFRVNTLKIDQSFVRDMLVDPEDATITLAVIGLAHNLGFKVIAEGVETEAQRDFLARHGCDEVQGFLFGKPVGACEFAALLRQSRGGRVDAGTGRSSAAPVAE